METGEQTLKRLAQMGCVLSPNSKWYRELKGLPPKKKTSKPPTTKQIEQREKFRCVSLFASQVNAAVKVGFFSQRKTEIAGNILFRQIMSNAVTGVSPDFQIDYPKVMLSKGILTNVNCLKGKVFAYGLLYITWEEDYYLPRDGALDTAFVSIYNATTKKGYNFSGTSLRDDLSVNFKIPDYEDGHELHGWIFFVGERNRNVSNSKYIKF